MPFAGTPDINFTAKAGTTLSGSDLTSWVDQITGVNLNSTTSPPQVSSAETLNGVNVVDFQSEDFIQDTDSIYDRQCSFNSDNQTNIYIVMKSPFTGQRHITSMRSDLTRNAVYGTSNGIALANGTVESPYQAIPANEWGVLRAVHTNEGGNSYAQIWWDNDLLWEDTGQTLNSSSGAGINLGGAAGFQGQFLFTMAQMVEYADQVPLTQQEHEQNLAEFETQWGLTLFPPYVSGPITKDGVLQAGVVVQVTAYDDYTMATGKQDVGNYVTDVDGVISIPYADVPAGKKLLLTPHNEDTGTLSSDQAKFVSDTF